MGLRGRACLAATVFLAALAGVVTAAPAGRAATAHTAPWVLIAQADTTSHPSMPQTGESDDEEEDNGVPIPPNLLEPEPGSVPPDTTGEPADSAGILAPPARGDSTGVVVPANPAQRETLFLHPPDPAAVKTGTPVVTAPKHRGGVFGLTPAVVILSLAVLHFFIVQTVK
jgi:hypothetical protein